MIIESMIAMTLLTANNHEGGLDIQIDKEDKENVNKDLKEYDTTLFDKDSKVINYELKKKQQDKSQSIKNDLFQNQASKPSRLDETKNVLFSQKSLDKTAESDKSPYIQDKQKRNIFPYILLSIGGFLTRYKALIIASINYKVSFESLVEGNLELHKGTPFENQIINIKTLGELKEQFSKQQKDYSQNYSYVRKTKSQVFKWIAIGISVLGILLLAFLAYIYFSVMKNHHQVEQGYKDYVKADYTQVLNDYKYL